MAPPHTWTPLCSNDTCHGMSAIAVSTPPKIRSPTAKGSSVPFALGATDALSTTSLTSTGLVGAYNKNDAIHGNFNFIFVDIQINHNFVSIPALNATATTLAKKSNLIKTISR